MTDLSYAKDPKKWEQSIRSKFPYLSNPSFAKPVVYFDNGASSQKPAEVLESVDQFYRLHYANVHRGIHRLSQEATQAFEEARSEMATFLHATTSSEIIFTKGLTEGVNLLASCLGKNLVEGDEVVVTIMEHHSNFVPWQILCEEKKLKFRVVHVDESGTLDLDHFQKQLNAKTKVVAVNHVSNTLGTINPISRIADMVHEVGATLVVDGAQAPHHFPVDVQQLKCDFYLVTGHKMYGPTGIGVLWGKENLLNQLPPYHGGGEMVDQVSVEKTTYKESPARFEAGTPNIAGAVGLAKAARFIASVGYESIIEHERELLDYAQAKLSSIPELRFIGQAKSKVGVISFVVEGCHPQDIATLLDQDGVALRVGHHCTQPLHTFFHIQGSIRASFAMYNTKDEVDHFVHALQKTIRMLIV
ncbi:MAG: cysteine desulfurase [Bdellovibrionota bacterium]